MDALHNAGISLITVAQCLDLEPYEHVGVYGEKDSTWTCDGPWTPPSAPLTSTPTTPTPTNPTPSSSLPTLQPTTNPACKGTYTTPKEATCTDIETMFNLVPGTLEAANSFLNCDDIWAFTPLCIPNNSTPTSASPTPSPSPPALRLSTNPACKGTYTTPKEDTCTDIETMFSLVPGTLKTANSFVDCDNIWAFTPLCIPNPGPDDV